MTFTYSLDLTTSKDKVRFRIGDTDSAAADNTFLSDEEIEATVTAQPNFSEAMAICAEALAAKFMRAATSKQVASVKVNYSDRVKNLLDLAERLRNGVEAMGLAEIVLTGTTETELQESFADTDLIQPAFTRGQFDNPTVLSPQQLEVSS